ncbi:DUF803-domain-containing protein [Tilletiaria anomala UBC 951]|uniref:DUF803-domain-containing protein n=1 Tax=Tilletiaria anomala (strain ATCC 24038 / CBS 436.72 / UBC 951) TaxID=1037660 RepID=A0A066VX17_TILAU|nr:DUF803-domain-containing protein [Tilletiaria anomala UBC 951]KDN46272.1 DUF803-domain-containing protein [Tilletiaria anomala UBC 951]
MPNIAAGRHRPSFVRRRASKGRIGRPAAGSRVFGAVPSCDNDADAAATSASQLSKHPLQLHYIKRDEQAERNHDQQAQQLPTAPLSGHAANGKQASQQAPASQDDGGYTYIPNLTRDKWIGLGLAISSSLAIGTSFIITKKGLIDAADHGSGLASDHHSYLQNPIWWAGMATMIVGEVANFAAYTFAPPILVTPLGALSVLIGAILASFILNEELGRIGRVGCTLCLVGTLIIILNAPEDKEIKTVDEILNYAIQPAFLFYCLSVMFFAIWMIYRVVPKWGKRTPLVYISICSSVGSISVMSVKGFGVALKLTLDGNNQFTHPSTYCFAIVVVVCILVQMNYFNKALDQFSTNVVNPIYYVMFTTSTIFASFLLFQGFNTEGAAPAMSLLCGFVVIFLGVYLLNLNRLVDPVTQQSRMSLVTGEGVPAGRASEHRDRFLHGENGMFHPRMSMSQQRTGGYGQLPMHSGIGLDGRGSRRGSLFINRGYDAVGAPHGRQASSNGSSVLFNAYDDDDEAVGLTRLNEHYDDEDDFGDGSTLRGSSSGSADKGGSGANGSAGNRTHSRTASVNNGNINSNEGRAKAHARSISLKLPDNLHENRVRHSPVLATASSIGSAAANVNANTQQQQQGNVASFRANLLSGMDD